MVIAVHNNHKPHARIGSSSDFQRIVAYISPIANYRLRAIIRPSAEKLHRPVGAKFNPFAATR